MGLLERFSPQFRPLREPIKATLSWPFVFKDGNSSRLVAADGIDNNLTSESIFRNSDLTKPVALLDASVSHHAEADKPMLRSQLKQVGGNETIGRKLNNAREGFRMESKLRTIGLTVIISHAI